MMESRIVMGLENAPEAKLIRQTVFVDEQGFKNEFDDTDNKAYHGILTDNGEPVSTGRLFTENGDYHIATGLECLFGWLYLSENTARADELFGIILKNVE